MYLGLLLLYTGRFLATNFIAALILSLFFIYGYWTNGTIASHINYNFHNVHINSQLYGYIQIYILVIHGGKNNEPPLGLATPSNCKASSMILLGII